MEKWLIKRAAESRVLVLPNGTQVSGADLESRLEGLMNLRKLLQIVERRGPTRDVILEVLDREAKDKAFFADRDKVFELAQALGTPTRTGMVQPDEEHQAHSIVIEDRSGGYPRHHRIDLDFVSTSEFRTLAAAYQDLKGFRGQMTVRTVAATQAATEVLEETPSEGTEEAPVATAPAAAKAKDADVKIDSLDALVEFFVAAGKKGFDINRYKGLGEMNPDTLWETTMDPVKRTLLQVRAEDHMEADLMFTTLMGDQVEPRRKFIEDNALEVKNLDI